MLHAYIRRFDVMNNVENFLGGKTQHHNIIFPEAVSPVLAR